MRYEFDKILKSAHPIVQESVNRLFMGENKNPITGEGADNEGTDNG